MRRETAYFMKYFPVGRAVSSRYLHWRFCRIISRKLSVFRFCYLLDMAAKWLIDFDHKIDLAWLWVPEVGSPVDIWWAVRKKEVVYEMKVQTSPWLQLAALQRCCCIASPLDCSSSTARRYGAFYHHHCRHLMAQVLLPSTRVIGNVP